MRPSSVCMPVRVTTVLRLAAGAGGAAEHQLVGLQQGPVTCAGSAERLDRQMTRRSSADRSIRTAPSMMRASAQTRSPSATIRTSPGTRSRAAISHRAPSRTTRAVGGRNAASASTACSACISCTNANAALSRITATTAQASAGVPPAHARTAATASRIASGWVNWRRARGAMRAAAPGQRVRPVHHQPPGGLPCGQPFRRRAQVAEQLGQLTPLPGVLGVVGRTVDGRRSGVHRGCVRRGRWLARCRGRGRDVSTQWGLPSLRFRAETWDLQQP